MKKFARLLLATSTILLSDITYASKYVDEGSNLGVPSGTKRSREDFEFFTPSPNTSSLSTPSPSTSYSPPAGGVEVEEENIEGITGLLQFYEPERVRAESESGTSANPSAGSMKTKDPLTLTQLLEEVTLRYTSYLDIQNLVNLASCSKGLHKLLQEAYHLDAMRAFITNDPSLDEQKGFELWLKIHNSSRNNIESLYQGRYNLQLSKEERNIDYSQLSNISNFSLFLYALGLIRSQPERIDEILQFPSSSDIDDEIKRRALDIFSYLSEANCAPKLRGLASKIYKGLYAWVIMENAKRVFGGLDRYRDTYHENIRAILKQVEDEAKLPSQSSFNLSEYSCYAEIKDAHKKFKSFVRTSQSSGLEKEERMLEFFKSHPVGALYEFITQNNPILKKYSTYGSLTSQQQKQLEQSIVKYATKLTWEMLAENRRLDRLKKKSTVSQPRWGF